MNKFRRAICTVGLVVSLSGCGGGIDGDGAEAIAALAIVGVTVGIRNITNDASRTVSDLPETTENLEATRVFAGPNQLNPGWFSKYGIVAFPKSATSEDAGRFQYVCEAFDGNLLRPSASSASPQSQAITEWPVSFEVTDPDFGTTTSAICANGVANYDLMRGLSAINAARLAGHKLNGRGPFLIAWSPAGDFGEKEGNILSYDMGTVEDPRQASDVFQLWAREIAAQGDEWDRGLPGERRRLLALRTVTNLGRRVDDAVDSFLDGEKAG